MCKCEVRSDNAGLLQILVTDTHDRNMKVFQSHETQRRRRKRRAVLFAVSAKASEWILKELLHCSLCVDMCKLMLCSQMQDRQNNTQPAVTCRNVPCKRLLVQYVPDCLSAYLLFSLFSILRKEWKRKEIKEKNHFKVFHCAVLKCFIWAYCLATSLSLRQMQCQCHLSQ